MDGGTDIIGHTATGHGRHSKRAGTETWTPAVPDPNEITMPTMPRHAAGRAVPPQRDRRGEPASAAAEAPLLPHLEPGKHEAASAPAADPVPVLAPVEYDRIPAPDPNADTDSFGLQKFNLGSVPASVTPPRSWRKAAWFSVAASGAALAALVAVASAFVGQGNRTTIDALPGLPSAQVPTEGAPDHGGVNGVGSSETTTTATGQDDRMHGTGTAGTDAEGRPGSAVAPGPSGQRSQGALPGGWVEPDSDAGSGDPATSSVISASSPPPPMVQPETSTAAAEPVRAFSGKNMNPDAGNQVSQSFYDEIADDPAAALQQHADGSMSAGERSAIRDRYADVQYVRVSNRYIDPNERFTRNTMKLYYPGEKVRTVTRTLKFTAGDHPRIVSEE